MREGRGICMWEGGKVCQGGRGGGGLDVDVKAGKVCEEGIWMLTK